MSFALGFLCGAVATAVALVILAVKIADDDEEPASALEAYERCAAWEKARSE